jgi:hypothetical protein
MDFFASVSQLWEKEVQISFSNTVKILCFGEYLSIETAVFCSSQTPQSI